MSSILAFIEVGKSQGTEGGDVSLKGWPTGFVGDFGIGQRRLYSDGTLRLICLDCGELGR